MIVKRQHGARRTLDSPAASYKRSRFVFCHCDDSRLSQSDSNNVAPHLEA